MIQNFVFVLLLFGSLAESKVKFKNNAYSGIVVAINPEIPEDPDIIEALKSALTDASSDLFVATKKRAYFDKITILVPTTWKQGTYDPSDGESYKKADVLVAYENPAYGNVPYTLQYGECGDPGTYIHLTPEYLLDPRYVYDYGPRGKTFVHEWAHLRWGVFDEVVTNGYDPYYISYAGKAEANRCPVTIQGDNYYVDWSSQAYRSCDIDPQTFLPEDGCVFVPDEARSAASQTSMMSYQYLASVTTFCHDDTSDPANLHNRAAPNEHNRLCNLRSTWDVIRSSSDFRNEANLPNEEIEDTTPEFEVVQPQSYQRFVLVLDTSGSMDENRMLMMRQAASTFLLQSVPTGSEVGMVDFDSKAKTLSEMRRIDDVSDRLWLTSLLPVEGKGGTSIGSGIREAIEVLEKGNKKAKGGILIVLSDGQENEAPYLTDVEDEIIASGVIVNAIVFTAEADPMLEVIATDTGGIWYFSDENSANATSSLTDAFVTVAKVDDGDVYRETFQIYSSSFTVVPRDQHIGRIIIDNTIGNNTMFSFTWSQYDTPLEVFITAPSGCNYGTAKNYPDRCETGYRPTVDSDLKIITFPISGTAERGTWTYFVNTGDNYQQNVVVTATSMAADRNVQPIVVESGMGQVTASDGEAIVVYAQVSMGYAPVLKAEVIARIERPSGGPVTIVLKDKGAAPDVRKNDGIYSRYFTKYNGPGRYSVQVSVTGIEGQTSSSQSQSTSRAAYRFGDSTNGGLSLNSNGVPPQPAETPTGNFSRYSSAGGFSFDGTSTSDVYPPSKIIDLSAAQHDVTAANSGVRVQFTSPGDDYDSGTVAGYDIRYSYTNTSYTDLLTNFESGVSITPSDVTAGSMNSPEEPGTDELFVAILPDLPEESTVTISIAVRAFDEVGNVGEISNVETFNYFIEPLVYEEPADGNADPILITMIVFVCLTAILLLVVGYLSWTIHGMKKVSANNVSVSMTKKKGYA